MFKKPIRFISFLLCFCLLLEQSGFAQVAGQIDISGYFSQLGSHLAQDKFRPVHLRYLAYDTLNNSFKLLLDKGDLLKTQKSKLKSQNLTNQELKENTKTLLDYFFIGLALPNESFWVNLRPEAEGTVPRFGTVPDPQGIIDPFLERTDIGRILLEADVQLKKDTARFTSPETPEGRKYWDRLYKKAEEVFGTTQVTIPTLVRPWIVPNEIIIREAPDNAYIYKATLKVMLEEDYIQGREMSSEGLGVYEFKDSRQRMLNEYSSQLIRELIIPQLTKEVNSAKRYAGLRQVYYSLILAQWFKQRQKGQSLKSGTVPVLIDSRNLTNLTSKEPWSKATYFQQYEKSFKEGEYNLKEQISTPYGQVIRTYVSGGLDLGSCVPIGNIGNVIEPGKEVSISLGDGSGSLSIIGGKLGRQPEYGKSNIPAEFDANTDTVKISDQIASSSVITQDKNRRKLEEGDLYFSIDHIGEESDFDFIISSDTENKQIKSSSRQLTNSTEQTNGLCLTPDSLIYFVDGTTKPLIQLVPGDMVLSLNEQTQKLEPHRVNALLDMGVKPVYRIRTQSGKELKTTLSHPYLTKRGWRKLKDIKVGEEIGVVRENLSSTVNVFTGINSINNNIGALKIETDTIFTDSKSMGSRRQVNQGFGEMQGVISREVELNLFNDTFLQLRREFSEFAFSRRGEFGLLKHRWAQEDISSSCLIFSKGTNPNFLASRIPFFNFDTNFGLSGRWVSMASMSHPTGLWNTYSLAETLSSNLVSKAQSKSQNEYVSKTKYLGEPFLSTTTPALKSLWDISFFSSLGKAANFSINSNFTVSFVDNFINALVFISLSPFNNNKYNTDILALSRLFSSFIIPEVEALGEKDDVLMNSHLLWDKIISITPIGYEQVYDIEVEGTHNFVAQGIVAHNTYIQKSGEKSQIKEARDKERSSSALKSETKQSDTNGGKSHREGNNLIGPLESVLELADAAFTTAEKILKYTSQRGLTYDDLLSWIKNAKSFKELADVFKKHQLISNIPQTELGKEAFVETMQDIWFALSKRNTEVENHIYQPSSQELKDGQWPAIIVCANNRVYYIHGVYHDYIYRVRGRKLLEYLSRIRKPLYIEQNIVPYIKSKLPYWKELSDHEEARRIWLVEFEEELIDRGVKVENKWEKIILRNIIRSFILSLPFIFFFQTYSTISNYILPFSVSAGGFTSVLLDNFYRIHPILNINASLRDITGYIQECYTIARLWIKTLSGGRDIWEEREMYISKSRLKWLFKSENPHILYGLEALPVPLRFDERKYTKGRYSIIKEVRSAIMTRQILEDLANNPDETNEVHILVGLSHADEIRWFLEHPEDLEKFLPDKQKGISGVEGASSSISETTQGVDASIPLSIDSATKNAPGGIDTLIGSVSMPQEGNTVGGIDFRALPIVTEPAFIRNLSTVNNPSINLNLDLGIEWSKIQRLVELGVIPSSERLKEYVAIAWQRGEIEKQRDKIICAIADILRLEEEYIEFTKADLKELLVWLEA